MDRKEKLFRTCENEFSFQRRAKLKAFHFVNRFMGVTTRQVLSIQKSYDGSPFGSREVNNNTSSIQLFGKQ